MNQTKSKWGCLQWAVTGLVVAVLLVLAGSVLGFILWLRRAPNRVPMRSDVVHPVTLDTVCNSEYDGARVRIKGHFANDGSYLICQKYPEGTGTCNVLLSASAGGSTADSGSGAKSIQVILNSGTGPNQIEPQGFGGEDYLHVRTNDGKIIGPRDPVTVVGDVSKSYQDPGRCYLIRVVQIDSP